MPVLVPNEQAPHGPSGILPRGTDSGALAWCASGRESGCRVGADAAGARLVVGGRLAACLFVLGAEAYGLATMLLIAGCVVAAILSYPILITLETAGASYARAGGS